ncbi:uncharacterized protein LOC127246743 [Andrographis paniculata]|uniref:uncharacterized protein LOC127246743 n=1 Tax=Andrographis paniculata TaxID=175694 RepID=UPI0021E740A0|nr:uncharacterized protein LOC127246743 [Andrographis paniculata]
MAYEEENPQPNQPLPRRTPPFSPSTSSRHSSFGSSSSSSSSMCSLNEELFSPLNPSMAARGIPFSWEQTPGIPKSNRINPNQQDQPSGNELLPLPPPGNPNSGARKTTTTTERDPFAAALVACSKDDEYHGSFWREGLKNTRSLSDRFGFISIYTSCKRTCAVSESIVYLPRSNDPHCIHSRRSR